MRTLSIVVMLALILFPQPAYSQDVDVTDQTIYESQIQDIEDHLAQMESEQQRHNLEVEKRLQEIQNELERIRRSL